MDLYVEGAKKTGFRKRLWREVKEEFLDNPAFCIWKVCVLPFALFFIFISAILVVLLNLSWRDGVDFLKQIF